LVQPVPALHGRRFTDQPPKLGPLRALLRCSPLGLFDLVSGHRRLPLPTTHLVVLLLLEPTGVKLLYSATQAGRPHWGGRPVCALGSLAKDPGSKRQDAHKQLVWAAKTSRKHDTAL